MIFRSGHHPVNGFLALESGRRLTRKNGAFK